LFYTVGEKKYRVAVKGHRLKSEVLTEVKKSMLISWVVAPCEFMGTYVDTDVSEGHAASICKANPGSTFSGTVVSVYMSTMGCSLQD
jgi:hypothetical protein